MVDMLDFRQEALDFRQEASGCLRLAEMETQSEVKTILMGMALGWLTLENQMNPPDEAQLAPSDEPIGESVDEPA
jgi:hypothetical protein